MRRVFTIFCCCFRGGAEKINWDEGGGGKITKEIYQIGKKG
jgi:hypothetical protein